jgi:hypothetical protein
MTKNYTKNKITSNGMKKISKYIFIIILFMFLSPILNLSAQEPGTQPCQYDKSTPPKIINAPCEQAPSYQLLQPLPDGTTQIDVKSPSALGVYLNIIIKAFIGLCAVLAVFMVFLGGIQYMTTEMISEKSAGKERIKNAIFGLILALSAYTILYTINPDLLNSNLDSLKDVVLVTESEDIPQLPVNGKYSVGGTLYDAGADWTKIATQEPTTLGGVATVNPPGDCSTVGQQNCTSLRGLSRTNIDAVSRACPKAQLVITGGTEFWLHSIKTSHRPGSATIDLRTNAELNHCLSGGKPLVLMQRYPNGALYEGDHWHIGN